MARIKIKRLNGSIKLNEHIEVENAEFITTIDQYDIFRILTYNAAQEFVNADNNRAAGENWTQSENTFNSNINDNCRLYFITNINTNRVVLGCLYTGNNATYNVVWENQNFRINYQLEDTEGHYNNLNLSVPINVLEGLPNVTIENLNNSETETEVETEDETTEIENSEQNIELNTENQNSEEEENETQEVKPKIKHTEIERNTLAILKIKIVKNEAIIVGCAKATGRQLQIPEYTEDGIRITTIDSYAFYNNPIDRLHCPYITKFKPYWFVVTSCFVKNNPEGYGWGPYIRIPMRRKIEFYYDPVNLWKLSINSHPDMRNDKDNFLTVTEYY